MFSVYYRMICDNVGATAPPTFQASTYTRIYQVDYGGTDSGTELSRNFENVMQEYIRVGIDSYGFAIAGIDSATVIFAEFGGASGTWNNASAQITITSVPPFYVAQP